MNCPAVLKLKITQHTPAKLREPEKEVVGALAGYPVVGAPLVFFSGGLEDPEKVRCILTSEIAKISWLDDGFEVETRYSTYRIFADLEDPLFRTDRGDG